MRRRLIIMFGGGGALGAFGCGIWKALSARMPDAEVIGVAGTSIGAVNAAFVARHGADLAAGAEAMESTWRQDLATPSLPFAGMPFEREVQSWNGLITGMLVGTRGLGVPNYAHWNPLAGLQRFGHPLMDRSRMWSLLASHLGTIEACGPDEPLLAAAAVDVMSGQLRLFNTGEGDIEVKHLSASAAIPLLFEPVSIDGRLYWDGDVNRQSALPLFLDALRSQGRLTERAGGDAETILVTVDQMSEEAIKPPASGVEIAYRVMELLTHGKMALPPEQLQGIDRVIALRRRPLPYDAVSGQFDYSPERIDELIALGVSQAEEAWSEACSETMASG